MTDARTRSRLEHGLHLVARLTFVRMAVRALDRLLISISRLWGFFRARALLDMPEGSACHWTTEIKYPENITLSGPVTIGPHCTLGAKGGIKLGAYVRLSKGVAIETASLDLNSGLPYRHISKPVLIEEGVWLGARAIILGGVRIGANAVVGAGAVIKKDVPAGAIVVGASARIIERKASYQE